MADLDDPYGTDVLMTDGGDLAVTAAGDLGSVDGPLNCGHALINRLRTYPGELPLQPDYGNPIEATIIGRKMGDPTLIVSAVAAELREILSDDQRFLAASSIQPRQDPAQPGLTSVRVVLELAAGDTLDVDDLAAASLDAIAASAGELVDLEAAADGLADFDGALDDDDVAGLDDDLEGLLPDGALDTDEDDT